MEHIDQKNMDEIKAIQLDLLKKDLEYTLANSAYYKAIFKSNSISAEDINSIDDLQKIPLTSKDDLQQRNTDFLCVPPVKIIDYITTSGTTGEPVLFGSTDKDLERLAKNEAYSFELMDLKPENIIQNTTTLDRRFMAGMAYYLGARRSGIGMIRVGSGVPELQWDTIKKFNPDTIICVPSFLLKMIEFAEKKQIDFRASSVKKALCIGEPIRTNDFELNSLGQRINQKWDIQLYSTYASTEMATAFTECSSGKGGHLNPEMIIAEIVDENGNTVEKGPGELVVTTLGVEAMPLIRFKTGDIVEMHTEKCECGRTTPRLGPVLGRKNQMIKYKGTTIYPPVLFEILNDMEEVENYIVEVRYDELDEDEILVKVGTNSDNPDLLDEIKDRFRAKLRVSPTIIFDSIENIHRLKFPENSRKSVTFIDNRNHLTG